MSLTNTQYEELMRAYDAKRNSRRRLVEQRKEKLYAELPRLKEIQDEIAALGVQCAGRRIEGDADAAASFSRQKGALVAEREAIYAAHGLPPDYLSPAFACPDCEDTGYIGTVPCRCFKQASINLLYKQSGLKELLETENFAHFSCEYYDRNLIDPISGKNAYEQAVFVKARCEAFARDFDRSYENLLLFGKTGLGKTMLACSIAKELLDSGHSVIYFSAAQLFELLAENAYRRGERPADAFRDIFEADLLIVDDLGTETPNTLTVSLFFSFLNERLNRRKPMVISTNLTLKELPLIYSERIYSRISNQFRVLHLCGQDIRVAARLRQS